MNAYLVNGVNINNSSEMISAIVLAESETMVHEMLVDRHMTVLDISQLSNDTLKRIALLAIQKGLI